MSDRMSEEKFWIVIWSLASICFCVLILSITATMWSKRSHLNEMVAKGADPIRAACALDMYDNQTVCVIHNVRFDQAWKEGQ